MLVLSRKKGERLVINNGEIVISVEGIYGKRVKLGIKAPSSVSVLREELQKENGGDSKATTASRKETTQQIERES